MEVIKMTIGEKLKKLRGKKTQVEISKELGVLPSTYSNYENDYRVPNDEIKKRIAVYYKKTVDEIFF
jgi:toxin-antitoxin system, antitoxin component, xre family